MRIAPVYPIRPVCTGYRTVLNATSDQQTVPCASSSPRTVPCAVSRHHRSQCGAISGHGTMLRPCLLWRSWEGRVCYRRSFVTRLGRETVKCSAQKLALIHTHCWCADNGHFNDRLSCSSIELFLSLASHNVRRFSHVVCCQRKPQCRCCKTYELLLVRISNLNGVQPGATLRIVLRLHSHPQR